MKKITFIVKGNQEDIHGNPVPYVRVVKRALWLPEAKRYNAWKSFVRRSFYGDYPGYLMRAANTLLTELQPWMFAFTGATVCMATPTISSKELLTHFSRTTNFLMAVLKPIIPPKGKAESK